MIYLIKIWWFCIKIIFLPITLPYNIYIWIRDSKIKKKERELINKQYNEEIEKR